MSEHVGAMKAARQKFVERRRALAKVFTGHGLDPDRIQEFINLDKALRGIDRAIEDEEGLEGSVFDKA